MATIESRIDALEQGFGDLSKRVTELESLVGQPGIRDLFPLPAGQTETLSRRIRKLEDLAAAKG
jgi:hypothetical protein